MRHLAMFSLIASLSSGCYIYASTSDTYDDVYVDDTVYNFAPEILEAEAGCYFDRGYGDDIWYFDAYVDDLDGLHDVTQVWADVYDEFDGQLVESFELYSDSAGMLWFSDWLGGTTYLDCFYDNYTVDIVAYDSWDAMDYVTIVPYTY